MKRIGCLVVLLLMMASGVVFAEAEQTDGEAEEEKSPYRGRPITLRDFGSHDLGFLSLPDAPPKYGVLLLPDSYGLDDRMKKRCDWIAEKGSIALGLDLFNGRVAESERDAKLLQKDLREEPAMAAIDAALHLLSESPRLKADHIVILSFGPQWAFTLPAVREFGASKISGMTWIEPKGRFKGELLDFFRNSRTPIQIINSPDERFLKIVEENLNGRRKNITFIIPLNESSDEVWKKALDFWHQCTVGNLARKQGFFERLFD